MSTMAEVQVRLGQKPQANILPCDRKFGAALRRAEDAWKGPLPGWVSGIQEDPLRVEIAGQPPLRMLRALRLPIACDQVAKYWQLRPERRVASVYHWRLGWCPLPALPAGISLPGGRHASFRQMVDWDTGRIVAWRVYVEEWVTGAVADAYPELLEPSPPAPGYEQAFGIDYDDRLQVSAITQYDYPIDSLTPSMLDQSRMRLACRERQ